MDAEDWLALIEEVGIEWSWKKNNELSTDTELVIRIGGDDHGIGYSIKTTPKGWLNVHFLDADTYKSAAVYSLRDTHEVTIFCALLRDTYAIRAKRRVGK